MPEDKTITRRWNLVRILHARRLGVTVKELMQELRVTDKTVRRDLDFLREQGFPIEERTEDFGRKVWKLRSDWGQKLLQFDFQEAAALYLGLQLLESMAGTPFWSAAHSAWRKIRSTLGDHASRYLDRFPSVFHCTPAGHRDYASKAELLETLTIAIEEYRAVHITYQSDQSTEPATRDVYPLRIIRKDTGALYLVAFAPEDDQKKTYKLDRIDAVEISSFVFQIHRDFDVDAFLAGSLGIYDGDDDLAVVIRFHPTAARHARESRWHRTEVFEPQRDGSLVLRLRLSSTVEIRSRVLAYGASATILEPESLRAEIADELRRMLHTYGAAPVESTLDSLARPKDAEAAATRRPQPPRTAARGADPIGDQPLSNEP
ncbi:MAG: helix-turn-helix transcriptional regulator [Isosphaeraceae bacterium]